MKNVLEKIKKEKCLCAVFTDLHLEKFSVYRIIQLDELYYLGEAYDPYGKYDGYICKLISEIIQINTKNEYLISLSKILNEKTKSLKVNLVNDDVVLSILKHAQSNNKICSFELQKSGIFSAIGYINSLDEENEQLEVKCYDNNGNYNGLTYFELGDITKVVCDSENERKIELLVAFTTQGHTGKGTQGDAQ